MAVQLVLDAREVSYLGKLCPVVSKDGADDCGGDGRGMHQVHIREQDIGRDISECGRWLQGE